MKSDPTSFEYNLRMQLEADANLHRRSKRLLAILDAPPSRRRTRRIEMMEWRAVKGCVDCGYGRQVSDASEFGKIDWSKVDWAKLIGMILDVLLKLLPLLLAI